MAQTFLCRLAVLTVWLLSAVPVAHAVESKLNDTLKGNLNQIVGVIVKPLDQNTISIKGRDGKEHSYEVRPVIQQRLAALSKGDTAVLLLDEENKVTDVAFIRGEH